MLKNMRIDKLNEKFRERFITDVMNEYIQDRTRWIKPESEN